MASLLTPDQEGARHEFDPKVQEDERRILLEIMQISRLEEEKKKGRINLDHLKRKNKATKEDEITQKPTIVSTAAVAPVMF